MSAAPGRLVALAVVARPHGVRGEVRLRVHNPASDVLLGRREVVLRLRSGEERTARVDRMRRAGEAVLAKIAGVDDRGAAQGLRGAEVCVPREALPEAGDDEVYVCDLVGLTVVGPAGTVGVVEGVLEYPTTDVLVVRGGRGTVEIPMRAEFLEEVDLDAGVVRVPAEAIAFGWQAGPARDGG